jgi:hypothetical protein
MMNIKYRFVATAVPDPNEYLELIYYAHFLGIMDMGEAKTRFFKRNSEHADRLTLHPHKEKEFWLWVASWAIFVQKPSDLGYSDEGYQLPPLDIRWHEIPTHHSRAGKEKSGQVRLLHDTAKGITGASREKRESLPARINKLLELRAEDPEAHPMSKLTDSQAKEIRAASGTYAEIAQRFRISISQVGNIKRGEQHA